MEPLTPRANSPAGQDSSLDDLFEGEPDLGFSPTPSSNNLDVVAAWLASRKSDAQEMQIDTEELQMPDDTNMSTMAHGGLGDGDTPYCESACEQRHESLPVPVSLSMNLPAASEPGICELPSSDCADYKAVHEWVRKKAHLASLKGEVFDQCETDGTTNDYDVYSATGSTGTISAYEDEAFPTLGGDNIAVAMRSTPLDQVRSVQLDCLSSVEQKQHEPPEHHQLEDPFTGLLYPNSIHSALWHAKPHLSEVRPADTQGHHPSIINVSAHSSTSRSSSLVEELLGTEESQLFPGTFDEEKQSAEVDVGISEKATPPVNMKLVHCYASSLIKDTSGLQMDSHSPAALKAPIRLTLANEVSSPLRLFDAEPSAVKVPDSTAINLADIAHGHTKSGILPPNLTDLSFQYNSARLTPPLRNSIESNKEPTQNHHQLALTQKFTSCQAWPRFWEKLEDDISHNPWIESQINPLTIEAKVTVVPEPVQPRDAAEKSTVLDVGMSSPYSPPSAVSPCAGSVLPPSSPLAGLESTIRLAKRGSRKATGSRRAVINEINTRGRAVSTTPIKLKGIAKMKSATASGVQDESSKITKTGRTKSARIASRTKTVIVKNGKGHVDGNPNVPRLPDSMDLDLPDLQSQPNVTQGQLQTHAEDTLRVETPELTAMTSTVAERNANKCVKEGQDILQCSQPLSHRPEISSQTLDVHVKIPKTRNSATSSLIARDQNDATSDNDRLKAIIRQMSEQTSTGTKLHVPEQQPVPASLLEPAIHDKSGPSTPSPRRRPMVRTATPYRVQKLILRPPRVPMSIPPIIAAANKDHSEPNSQSSLPNTAPTVQTPNPATLKSKSEAKPKSTPRKTTPAASKTKQSGSGTKRIRHDVSGDVIPPVPPIPATPTRNLIEERPINLISTPSLSAVNNGARLTPRSVERIFASMDPLLPSPSPLPAKLRRSPRLSGVRPR